MGNRFSAFFGRRPPKNIEPRTKELPDSGAYRSAYSLLPTLVRDGDKRHLIAELRDFEAQAMVHFLSKILDSEDPKNITERKEILHTLASLSKDAKVLPDNLRLENVDCDLRSLFHHGAYGDIYKGTYDAEGVCVKALHSRVDGKQDQKSLFRILARETILSAFISHNNILPLYGVYFPDKAFHRICIISPWMDNGDISRFLEKAPKTDRLPLIMDIISGLQYLHEMDIVHSDIKAKNILVSPEGRAILADFGASRVADATRTRSIETEMSWMAPELLLGNIESATKECDIWAFACTCYEIIVGARPLDEYTSIVSFIQAFKKGQAQPILPSEGINKHLRESLTICWNYKPSERPTASDICRVLTNIGFKDRRSPARPGKSRARINDSMLESNTVYEILQRIDRTPQRGLEQSG